MKIKSLAVLGTALALCSCTPSFVKKCDRVHFNVFPQCMRLDHFETYKEGAYIKATYVNMGEETIHINGFYPYSDFVLVEKGSTCLRCGSKGVE